MLVAAETYRQTFFPLADFMQQMLDHICKFVLRKQAEDNSPGTWTQRVHVIRLHLTLNFQIISWRVTQRLDRPIMGIEVDHFNDSTHFGLLLELHDRVS